MIILSSFEKAILSCKDTHTLSVSFWSVDEQLIVKFVMQGYVTKNEKGERFLLSAEWFW